MGGFGVNLHCVVASGGNAGLAAAYAARILGVKCTVFIPEGVTQSTLDLLRQEGAEVVVVGRFYAETVDAANQMVASDPNAVMIPAYEHHLLWKGHSSMMVEIRDQLQQKPDAIFCSVGGGGLLGGIILGCKKIGWDDVPIVTLETIGSDCFYRSMIMNENGFNSQTKTLPPNVELIHDADFNVDMAHFHSFSSRASGSLGASQPAAKVLRAALDRPGGVYPYSVPDGMSMDALLKFADDQKMLVELACSTTLVPIYHPTLFERMVPSKPELRCVVFIVCGGSKISLGDVAEFQRALYNDLDLGSSWQVQCDDGELLQVPK